MTLSSTQPADGLKRPLLCPAGLQDTLRAFIAEEAISSTRHDLRNKLGLVRNGVFYIRRKLEGQVAIWESDPRLGQFLKIIDDEMVVLGDSTISYLAPANVAPVAELDPVEVASRFLQSVSWPQGLLVAVPKSSESSAPARIRANPSELELALFCLVENAVEAMESLPERAVQLRVAPREKGLMAIAVSDTGPGFDGASLSKVLQPFFSTKPARLGVGLKIAKRIAGRWGGKIEMGPSEQGGACATLVFPAIQPAKTRVLLVDDASGVRMTLAALLEDAGYQVTEADSLASGRSKIGTEHYDLAIVDLHLGDGSGTVLIAELAARQPQAVVAVMSGSQQEPVEGVALFLTKADAPDQMLRRLEQALGEARARRGA